MDQTFWGVMQITLIHALRHSPPPIEASFERLWPDARLRNILDDGLSADLAREGKITPAMTQRFLDLAAYADAAAHDRLAVEASRELAGCNAIALAQFSLARAAAAVRETTGRPVLTTPDCAVRKLRRIMLAEHDGADHEI